MSRGPSGLDGLRLPAPLATGPGTARLLPPAADPYFRVESVTGGADLEASFAVLVGVEGELTLVDARGDGTRLAAGETLLLPYAYGARAVRGSGRALRCRPPAPPAVARDGEAG